MPISQSVRPEQIIACNPGAIHPDHRDSHATTAREIFSQSSILEVKETANGYAFRFSAETPMLYKVIDFIANERLCCPFFTFTLTIGDEFWLELSGSEEAKTLIQMDILKSVNTGVFPSMLDLQAAYEAAQR